MSAPKPDILIQCRSIWLLSVACKAATCFSTTTLRVVKPGMTRATRSAHKIACFKGFDITNLIDEGQGYGCVTITWADIINSIKLGYKDPWLRPCCLIELYDWGLDAVYTVNDMPHSFKDDCAHIQGRLLWGCRGLAICQLLSELDAASFPLLGFVSCLLQLLC